MYGEASPAWPGTDRPAPAAKAPWSGGGGRWTVWPMRIILWAAILVIGYRGIMAIALNEKPASSGNGAAATATGPAVQFSVPVTLAEAFALQFGRVYLTFHPADAATRQAQLQSFVAPNVLSANPQFGMNGQGVMQLSSESVAGIDVRSPNSAVVTLLAAVNGRQMEFGVPIYANGGALIVSGLPSVLPAPLLVVPPQPQFGQQDDAAVSQLQAQLTAFFIAYASGDATLARFLAPGASVGGLGGAVQFKDIVAGSLHVPQGGATREITVTVDWLLGGGPGGFAATYDMSVVDQQGGRWYVEEIRASTQPMGTAP